MPIDLLERKNNRSRALLSATLLDPTLLQDEIALENAVGVLEGHLKDPRADKQSLLTELMSKNNLFACVFSAMSDEAANATKQYIINVFPTKALVFEESLSLSLLVQLSQYFWYHNFPAPTEYYHWVQMSRAALESMVSSNPISTEQPKSSPAAEQVEVEFEGLTLTQWTSQGDRKIAKRAANAIPSVDVKLFGKLDLKPPRSAKDVIEVETRLLGDLKDILVHYLEVLREPRLVPTFKTAYIALPTTASPNDETRHTSSIDKTADVTNTDAARPVTYANILPLRATLNFDPIDGFGDWHILLSTRANQDLRDARHQDAKRFITYVKKIRELSKGHFSANNHNRFVGNDGDIPVYEAKMIGNSRLVYQIDCIREFDDSNERQVIKIFGIYTHAQLKQDKQAWHNVSKHLSGRGSEYRRRCIYRVEPVNQGDSLVFSPATFPLSIEQQGLSSSAELQYLKPAEQQDLHERLVLEKFSAFSQALLNNILAEEDAAHVFLLSPTEQDIVRHVGSCYVYGRSGTGKTTTMVYKILGIERAHEIIRTEYDADALRPRQLFVTYSRVLAEKVQEFYAKLALEKAAAGRTARESTRLAVMKIDQDGQGLVDKDEEEFYHGTLPRSFSKLTDEHFPLFITFDQLSRLLQADQDQARSRTFAARNLEEDTDLADEYNDTTEHALQRRKTFVSYIKFYNEYWRHLPQNLTKNLDPALVFAEIMGVIKGSEESILTEKGFLERDTYINLSHRSQATFATCREVVYSLFQAYTKRKQERREWDAADRTHSIIRGLREFGVPGRKVDFIYIDEAQDNLLVDALILRSMCKSSSGLFWAGDTAQTISASSSFRFEELKAFLFRVEKSLTSIPDEFKLTVNYRSHGGIVRAAHSVVHLISTFWPHAIDSLPEEKGIVDGAKPVFFTGQGQDRSRFEEFFFGAPESQIEFGANQCILVRDDAARKKLLKPGEDVGTVLTLYESKGLEFNDVLLYNFFEDSTVDANQWRVILNALPSEERIRCPIFDDTRHNGVCRELKFLYVAITRARQNLWIADSSEKGEPLRLLWTRQGLVESASASQDMRSLATGKKSLAHEWAKTGKLLFDNKQFSQASQAFGKAGLFHEKDIAAAYYRREVAHRTPQGRSSASDPRRQAFLEAAEAFSLCANVTPLAKARLSYYRNSAECYQEASEIKKAGEMYLLAEEHTEAAKVFRKGGLFDEAVDTIDKYSEQIEPADAEKIRDVAKIHYSLEQNLDRATMLFSDVDKALEFMDDYGFNVARVELLERYGRLREAAEIHIAEGRTIEAIQLLLRDKAAAESQFLLERILLKSIRQYFVFGMPLRIEEDATRSQLQHLLRLAEEAVKYGALSSRAVDELSLCRAILNNDHTALHTLADKFIRKHGDLASAVLCLDYVFQTWTHIESAAANVVWTSLERFSLYTRELQQMPFERNLPGNEHLQRLFGFYPNPDAEDLVVIPTATLVYQFLTTWQGSNRYRIISVREDAFVLTSWGLPAVLKAAIREHLQKRIRDENYACFGAAAFRICPVFMVIGERDSRHRERCSISHDPQDMTLVALESRLRMLWQQLHIYQWATVFERRNEFAKQRRRWISRLYESYFPIHYKAGSALDVDLTTIPEANRGVQIMLEWIHDLLLSEDFARIHPPGFLTFIAEAVTLSLRFEKSGGLQYLKRAPCITRDRPEAYIREGGKYIVWDLLDFLGRTSVASLSFGVHFVKNVCERQLPIDANVLCHIVELLCAAYSIGHRVRVSGSLHDITLSRRLLSQLHADETLKAQDHRMLWQFVGTMSSLLRELYSGSSGFLLHNQSPRIDYLVRHIFVMRICKSFTLLGYNINDPRLHQMILYQIASFKSPDGRYSNIYQRYINASSWIELKRAVRSTGMFDKNTPEELTHLRDATKVSGTPHEEYGTRSVLFATVSEIPTLLQGAASPNPRAAPIRQGLQSTHAPSASGDANVNVTFVHPLAEHSDTEGTASESVDAHLENSEVDEGAASEDKDADLARHTETAPTADEIGAAKLFATLYRGKSAHKRSAIENGEVTESDQLYRSYQASPLLGKMPRRYKLLFLGPLPLAFLALRAMAVHVANAKSQAKARLTKVSHSMYEKVAAQIKEANSINRRIQQLKSILEPKSEFHATSSEAQLRTYVQDVAEIAAKYPSTIHGKEWELKTAVKGIVQEPKKPTSIRRERPALVDDIDGYEAY